MTSYIIMLTLVPSCPTRSWSLRQVWIRRLMALIRNVSVSTPRYPCRGSCWRGAGALWSHNCWSPRNMTIEKRFVFIKIVRCFYIKLAWKKFRLAIHMDFSYFLCCFFPPGTTSIVGDGSRVFKTVPVWQLSNGLTADSQGPVPRHGPVRNDSGRGEWIFCRDDRTYRCLTGPDKMTRKYCKVTIKGTSQRREDYAGLHMKQPLFNQTTNHRRTHLLHARKVWETVLTRTMSDPMLDYWKIDH